MYLFRIAHFLALMHCTPPYRTLVMDSVVLNTFSIAYFVAYTLLQGYCHSFSLLLAMDFDIFIYHLMIGYPWSNGGCSTLAHGHEYHISIGRI